MEIVSVIIAVQDHITVDTTNDEKYLVVKKLPTRWLQAIIEWVRSESIFVSLC